MNKGKKIGLIMGGIIVILLLIFILIYLYCSKNNKNDFITDNENYYDIAVNYIKNEQLNNGYDKDKKGYNVFVNYKGFGITSDNNYKYVYMWILEESHYLDNNEVKKSESSSMAYKFTFKDNEIIKYELPKDGSEYEQSIKDLFPTKIENQVLNYMSDLSVDDLVNKYYSEYNRINVDNLNEINGLSMTIKENTLTNTSATIIITDNSGKYNTFGNWFRIDKKVNNEWREVESIHFNYVFNEIGLLTNDNNQLELDEDWEYMYGKLEKGSYRLVKNVYDDGEKYFSVKFDIK